MDIHCFGMPLISSPHVVSCSAFINIPSTQHTVAPGWVWLGKKGIVGSAWKQIKPIHNKEFVTSATAMQDAGRMCTSISRLFCNESWAEASSRCTVLVFLPPEETGSFVLGSRRGWDKATSFTSHCRSQVRFDVQGWQERTCSACTPAPSMGLWHVTTHTFSAVVAKGWLFWCPQNCCLSWRDFGNLAEGHHTLR